MLPAQPRPTQAVILAGGRGTRLAPLTDTRSKAMVEFHGKPFVEYLVELAKSQGFEKFLFLLGYQPESVRSYFGDGARWGVKIEYSVTPVEDETGTRVRKALPLLDPVFLLMYCDNYWPMPFPAMWERFSHSDALALVTVYRNADSYTRDNLVVEADGRVSLYDKTRKAPGLKGVDLGFIIMRREALQRLPEGNVSLEATLYPSLIADRKLIAHVTDHRYYSVGNLERLPITAEFLERKPAVILDRDGVLNRKMPKATYVQSWKDWEWLPGAREALKIFKHAGYRVVIITNQAGIARGHLSERDLAAIHERMKEEVEAAGGRIDRLYFCPHHWDDGCECRKPKPGMLFQAQRDLHLDLSRTVFVGDDTRDGEAAEAAGCPFVLLPEGASLADLARQIVADAR
jgi:D-glycero-D-manno-heptose 1,7-bisphosphate phosphatase